MLTWTLWYMSVGYRYSQLVQDGKQLAPTWISSSHLDTNVSCSIQFLLSVGICFPFIQLLSMIFELEMNSNMGGSTVHFFGCAKRKIVLDAWFIISQILIPTEQLFNPCLWNLIVTPLFGASLNQMIIDFLNIIIYIPVIVTDKMSL